MLDPVKLPEPGRLFAQAPCGLLLTDTNGLIRVVNQTFCRWLGYEADALIGKRRVQDLFTIGGRVFHQTHLAPLLQMQGSVAEVQLDMRHADGHPVPMLFNTVRRQDGVQSFDEMAVFVATDRRKYEHELLLARKTAEHNLQALAGARQELQESRDVLGIAMRGAKMGVWSRDIASGAVWFSSELEALAGLEEGSFGGGIDDFYALIHPADLDEVKATVDEALARVCDCSVEFRLAGQGGRWTPMDARVRLGLDAAGNPATVYGIAIDISERVQADSLLRREAAILADQSDAIVVVDGGGKILDANPATQRIMGRALAELAGQRLSVLYGADDRAGVDAGVAGALEQQSEWRGQLSFVRKDGSLGFSESVIKPLVDRKGRTYGAVSVNRDVTERERDAARLRELNADLARADRKKDEFLATLAHELRNPLAPLRNVLEILKLKSSTDAQMVWACEVFERQMHQMTHLVDDLMEVSRITQGRIELRRETIDVGAIMRAAAEATATLMQAGQHKLSLHLPAAPMLVDADPTRLTQILINLLNNAAKYTPDGGYIWFEAVHEPGWIAMTVRDSGIGIARDNLENVFTMFAQLEPGLPRSQGGLGIGLALVKGLVTLHGGTISAHSAGVGQGSEFTLRLPAAAAAALTVSGPVPDALDSSTAVPVAGRRILVVDDNRDGADMLHMALVMLGHEVHCAYDGMEAIATGQSVMPEVVVLDIGLPDMDGYAVARHIRKQDWGRHVVLIAATGWGQQGDRDAAEAAGFDHHMVKPVDFSELDAVLRQV